ncbi:MAG: PD-(D/E)XK nuclease family protein, partial [Patescibacteria group bacterium]
DTTYGSGMRAYVNPGSFYDWQNLEFYTSAYPNSRVARMTIQHSGNVGIGTTAPGTALTIGGTGQITVPDGTSGLPSYGFSSRAAHGLYHSSTYVTTLLAGVANKIDLDENNGFIRIADSTNQLILGTDAASPSSQILRTGVATGADHAGANLTIQPGNGTGTGGSGSLIFQTAPVGSTGTTANTMATAMTILNTGNVGIGTTTPSGKLSLVTGADRGLVIDSTGEYEIMFTGANTANIYSYTDDLSIHANTGKMLKFGSNGAQDQMVLNAGNVGIGTTNPLQKLHVEGQCMTGDTLIPIRRKRKRKKNGESEEDEAEGGIYDYLLVPIRDIQPGDEVLSLNEDTNTTEYKKINALMDMGVKEIFEIKTKSGRVIRTTANHPYLIKIQNPKSKIQEKNAKIGQKISGKFITIGKGIANLFRSREVSAFENRDIAPTSNIENKNNLVNNEVVSSPVPSVVEPKSVLEIFCPYCEGSNFVKRGLRKKKSETIQLYLCNTCMRTFTPGSVKGKHYSMATILDAISLYNLGYSLEQATGIANKIMRGQKEQGNLQPSSLLNWLRQFGKLCTYDRMRSFGMKMYKPEDIISSATLAHRQLYRFRYHRAKVRLIIEEDFKHSGFWPLKEFLDLVPVECPHQYFQQGLRASEVPVVFSKTDMIVRSKQNYATKLAKFILESVKVPKERHDSLQRFLLANDSVTIATEVPVYLRKEDLEHMKTQLGFEMFHKESLKEAELRPIASDDLPKLITGHIDFLQIRNGMVHILDYKPNAIKERPIEQLTLYALALSRLTGLRVYNFKCAWFDEKDYLEFYPLHVVYKRKKGRRKRITTIEGTYKINENPNKIEQFKPS